MSAPIRVVIGRILRKLRCLAAGSTGGGVISRPGDDVEAVMDDEATLTDEEIETRSLTARPRAATDDGDTGDDTGDVSDTSDTGDDSGDTGDDSGDVSDTADTGDDAAA
jgi:hypothetical protein